MRQVDKGGESGSAKALTTSTRGTVQVLLTIKGFLQILRISAEDVLYSVFFVYSHE